MLLSQAMCFAPCAEPARRLSIREASATNPWREKLDPETRKQEGGTRAFSHCYSSSSRRPQNTHACVMSLGEG